MKKTTMDELTEVREQIAALSRREAEIVHQMLQAIGVSTRPSGNFNPNRNYSPHSCGGRLLALLATGPKTTTEIHQAIPMTGTQAELSRLRKAGRVRQAERQLWELVNKPDVSPTQPTATPERNGDNG